MENRIPRIWAELEKSCWAILPEKLEAIMAFLRLAAERESVPMAAASAPAQRQVQHVAVLPLFGTISHRAGLLTQFSGGTSTEVFIHAFRQVVADSKVGAVVIEVDSPGGNVTGIPETAQEVLRSRGRKPIVAVGNALVASAAFWIASAADEFVVTPSGRVGSIGVLAVYPDTSGLEGKDGVVHRIFAAGKYKAEMNPYEPLADSAAAHLQAEVNRYYEMFVADVAKGRDVSVGTVKNGFGEGRLVGAKEAVAQGMADRVATLDETIVRLTRQDPKKAFPRAADERAARRYKEPPIAASVGDHLSFEDRMRMNRLRYL